MQAPVKLLVILVGETDSWEDIPLYEAICNRLVQLNAPGATVQSGIMGYGSHGHLHRKRLFGVVDEKPISISIVDSESDLRERVIPAIRPMISEGLMFLTDVEVIE